MYNNCVIILPIGRIHDQLNYTAMQVYSFFAICSCTKHAAFCDCSNTITIQKRLHADFHCHIIRITHITNLHYHTVISKWSFTADQSKNLKFLF